MKKIFAAVKPGAKKNELICLDETHFRISVKAPPDEGRANEAVIEMLKEHFGYPKSCFQIVSGLKSKQKVIQIRL